MRARAPLIAGGLVVVAAAAVLVVLLTRSSYAMQSTSTYQLSYPKSWTPQTITGSESPGLVFGATGTASAQCPTPEVIVREGGQATAPLDLTVAVFMKVQAARHHGLRVATNSALTIPGASQAVYIQSSYNSGSVAVQTYDILALSSSGTPFHVYAQGCAADLPSAFDTTLRSSFRITG